MTITTTSLTKAAGMAAAAAGAIFIAVQINHPATDSFLTATNQWVVRCTAKAVMCALALAGITGIYLRQVRQMRVLGLVGFCGGCTHVQSNRPGRAVVSLLSDDLDFDGPARNETERTGRVEPSANCAVSVANPRDA